MQMIFQVLICNTNVYYMLISLKSCLHGIGIKQNTFYIAKEKTLHSSIIHDFILHRVHGRGAMDLDSKSSGLYKVTRD